MERVFAEEVDRRQVEGLSARRTTSCIERHWCVVEVGNLFTLRFSLRAKGRGKTPILYGSAVITP